MTVVAGDSRGEVAWPLYLCGGQGQVNTRRDQPGVGGQHLHDLASSWSQAGVPAPAGCQQKAPEEKMKFSSPESQNVLQLGAQANWLGQSLAFLDILHHLVV